MPRTPAPTPTPQALPWPHGVPKPLSAPPLTDAPSDGPKVIRWIERNCVFGEGDKFGERVKLETFEKIFLIWLFERRPDGRYRYRRALLEVPKGNGKTPISAWIGAYQLANQFSPVIPVAAASYDQAELLFGDMRTTVRESPTLRDVMIPFEGEIQVKDGPGRAYKVAAIAGTNDGNHPPHVLPEGLQRLREGLQRRDIGRLGGHIGTPGGVQRLHELAMKRRRLRTECLEALTVGGEQRRDGRRHLILSRDHNPGRRGHRRPNGRAEVRADGCQVRCRRGHHLRRRDHIRHLGPPPSKPLVVTSPGGSSTRQNGMAYALAALRRGIE